jgi:hypothetical protein
MQMYWYTEQINLLSANLLRGADSTLAMQVVMAMIFESKFVDS